MPYFRRSIAMGFFTALLILPCFAMIQRAGNTAPALIARHVAPGDDCNGMTPSHATVQAAVDEVDPGDVIKVAEGAKMTT